MTTRERSVFEMEYADERILRAWWRVNGSRLDADHLLLMVEDVTEERKLREQQMSSLRLEAIAAVAGGVAHDLNNMLGAILLTAARCGSSSTTRCPTSPTSRRSSAPPTGPPTSSRA